MIRISFGFFFAIAGSAYSIVIGGYQIRAYADIPVQNILKIKKSDCALDTTFTQSTGFDNAVTALAVSGNSLYVGGKFSSYRGLVIMNNANYFESVDLITGIPAGL